MELFIVFISLLISILLYFWVAQKFGIMDIPNQRASHNEVTIRGGGIIFPLAALIWFIIYDFQFPYFFTGLLLVSSISFLDDIFNLSFKLRLAVQFVGVFFLLIECGLLINYPIIISIALLIIIVGFCNMFNFMDGINGITGLYAFITLCSLCYINSKIHFIDQYFQGYLVLSTIVFLLFNFRKRAKTFAGDVGSISMAFILSFILLFLILFSDNYNYLGLISVYAVDSTITIFQRLLKKENIFSPHRSHLYQYLANEMKWGHLKVSLVYSFIQLVINIMLLFCISNSQDFGLLPLLTIVLGLTLFYIIYKQHILQQIENIDN